MTKKLTQERLKELLHYDPDTGVFTRRSRSCNRWDDAGKRVGNPGGKGYLQLMIDRVAYKLHRLAFLYVTASMPDEQVDHINGVVTDNRWRNLRLASAYENMQNRKLNANNSTGMTGVHKHPSGWVARIGHRGERRHLGLFTCPEDAYSAYLQAKRELHQLQPTPRQA